MEVLLKIFGEGKDLDVLQMSCRGVVIFFVALLLIRLSGRRSFGIKNAFDNIIGILLGAVLSRTVVGASPFLPTIVACMVICLLHRACAWISVRNDAFDRLMNGNKIMLYKNGDLLKEDMHKALVNEKDIQEGLRRIALTDDLGKTEAVYLERNGEISAIKKEQT
jgi:uncharacterized membrane protein YcaP (DUF421 family)